MGYTTDFSGEVQISPPLNSAEIAYLRDFNMSRRMYRDNGPLYAVPGSDHGQAHADDIRDYNQPDPDQPGLWCGWTVTDDGTAIVWDEGEKFYNAAAWMKYLTEMLLAPSSAAYIAEHKGEDARLALFTSAHTLNGEIDAQGENPDDRWRLVVRDNEVFIQSGEITYATEVPV